MISLNLFSPWFQWEQAVLWRGRRWDLILRRFSDVCWAHYIPKKVPFLPGPTSAENPGTIEFVSFHMFHDTGICTYYVYLFIYLFVYLFICVYIYLYIYLFIYLFNIYTYLHIYIYIYTYIWVIFGVNVGKYPSTMEHVRDNKCYKSQTCGRNKDLSGFVECLGG